MFLARGLCYVISVESIPINDPTFYRAGAQRTITLPGDYFITPAVVIALVVVADRGVRAAPHPVRPHGLRDRRQRAVGAADGPAGRPHQGRASTSISGFCAGARRAAVLASTSLSGYSLHAVGMELDAIAAVVIGGTLLTGGRGLRARLAARRAGARHDPDVHLVRRHPELVVDQDHRSACCCWCSSSIQRLITRRQP